MLGRILPPQVSVAESFGDDPPPYSFHKNALSSREPRKADGANSLPHAPVPGRR
jgi:hypothetical protein